MKNIYKILLGLFFISTLSYKANAQGCVAVRQMGGVNPVSSSGYTLSKGEFQLGTNYRYFNSWRHYVGTKEQPHRQTTQGGFTDGDITKAQRGNGVRIYSHSTDFNLSYGINDRLQLNASLPYVHNERSQVLATKTGGMVTIGDEQRAQTIEGVRYSVYAQGIGDLRLSGNYWLFNPAKAVKGNMMVGLGLKLPTGSYSERDNGLALNSAKQVVTASNLVMDQAIQPGDGGLGISVELQGFRELSKNIYGFANGFYMFSPKESNGSFKSAPTAGLEGYNIYAVPDQYFARAGAMTSVGKSKNATFSLAGRLEGIPAYDAIGGQVAYRRPGYVVAVEPGASYRNGKHSFSLFVPVNFIRNRIQSAADIANQDMQNAAISDPSKKVHVQGDAAFADYSINLGYTFRLGKLTKSATHEDHKM